MDEKQLKALYEAMSPKLDLPDFTTFKGQLSDDKFRKAFYDEASTELDLGDFDSFSSPFKKKEPTTTSAPSFQPASQFGIPQTETPQPAPTSVETTTEPTPIDDFTKRYKSRVEAGTNYLDARLKDKMLKETDVNKATDYSEFFGQAKKMNAEGRTKDRVQYVYDFLKKNSDIDTNKETRDAFVSSQYAGEYYSESPSLKADYESSALKNVLTPRQYTGYKSLTFGQKDYADKLLSTINDPKASEQDKEIAKISLDNYGIDVDKDAASSMLVKETNKDMAANLFKKADSDFYANKDKVRDLEYQNPYSITSISGIIERATKRGLAMGQTADILTATSKESGIDVNRLADIQRAQQDARSSKAYEQFSEDPSWENFKKNPIGILAELSLESLVALYSHGSSRIGAGAVSGALMGAPIAGIGAAVGASSGAIAGMGMSSLNLEFSSTLLEGITNAGYDITKEEDLKKAFSDDALMSELKSTAYKKGIPVAMFDMLSAGVAGKILKGATTVGGKILAGAAETGVQAAAGAGGEATSQLVAYGKITSPNAILMEAIGELGPGAVEIAYGNIVENAKKGKPQSKEDLVTAASKKDESINAININQGAGVLTKEQADAAKSEILSTAELVNKMPQDMSDKAKAEVAPLIEQRNNLQKQIESVDESFKPQLKSELDALDKQIQDIYTKDKSYATTTSEGVVKEGVPEGGIVQPTRTEAQGQEAAQPQADVSNRPVSSERQITPEEVQVSSDATGFAEQMSTARESLGGAGLSVTPYPQQEYDQIASEGGQFLRADNNNILALLKPSGEMVSLVKNATSKVKGAAQTVINKMKSMGGLFMDNYDIYLTPLYEKAGYKVVARVPFDEQYAPEGWNAEGSTLKNKPDVVFMVRNDIAPATEQKFGSYEEAAKYTNDIVSKAVAEGKAKTPKEVTSISKTIENIIPNVRKSLADSGVSIDVVDNEEDAVKVAGEAARGNQGIFISKEGKIVIDSSKLANAIEAGIVVWHEASHPVMNIIRNTNKPLYDKISAGLSAAAQKNEAVKSALDWATEQYSDQGEGTVADEAIVETIGRIGSGVINPNTIETGVKQALIDFINNIAKAFGFDQILDDTDVATFKRVASQVADALRTGRNISEIVGEENVKATEAQNFQLSKKSSEIAKRTEDKTVEGKAQPSMILMGKKKGEDVELYSGPASIENLRNVKPDMYVSRAQEFSKSNLVPGKVEELSKEASKEQKLKWADDVYNKAKATVVSNLLFIFDSIPAHIRDISKLWYDGANVISQELSKKYNTTLEQAAAVVASQSPQKPWYDNVHLGHFIMDFFATKQDMVFNQDMYDYYELKSQPTKAVPAGYPKQKEYLPTLKKAIGKKFSDLSNYDRSVMIRYDFDNNYDRRAPLRIPTGVIVGKVSSNSSFSGYDTIAKGVSIMQDGSEKNISDNLGKAFKVRNFNNNISNPKMDGEVTIDTHAMAAAYMLPLGASSTEVKFDEGTYSFFADAYREAAKQRGVLTREMQSIVWEGVRALFPDTEKSEAKKQAARDMWSKYKSGELPIENIQNQIKENGKDLSITDWSKFTDAILEEDGKRNYIEELSLSGRNQAAAEFGVGGGVGRGLPSMGERGVPAGQASRGERENLLAPNGKPSNLTPEQYRQVRTPQFKKWFGDWENDPANASKIVDENGEPRVVYHGTNVRFDEFKKEKLGSKNWLADSAYTGFFFAGDEKTSQAYVGINNADWMGMSLVQSPILTNVIDKYKSELESAKKAVKDVLDSEIEKVKAKREIELAPVIDKLKKEGISEDIIRRFVDNFPGGSEAFENANKININNGNQARLKSIEEKIYKEVEKDWMKAKGLEPIILNLFLNIKNPFVFDFNNSEEQEGLTGKIKSAKLNGNDGVVFKNLADGGDVDDIFVAFEPNQIKSATENVGEFSTTDNRMQASRGGRYNLENDFAPVKLSDIGVELNIESLSNFDGPFKDLLSAIKKAGGDEVSLNYGKFDRGLAGLFYPKENLIEVNSNANVNEYYTATHELVHWLTLNSKLALKGQSYNDIKGLYTAIKSKVDKKTLEENIGSKLYGLSNVEEFMAELMLNEGFRNSVSDITATNKEVRSAVLKNANKELSENFNKYGLGYMLYKYVSDVFKALFGKYNIDSTKPAIQNAVDIFTKQYLQEYQASKGGRTEMSKSFKLSSLVMRMKSEGATTEEIVSGVASMTGMSAADIKPLVDNPEQWLMDQNPGMSELAKKNMVERAKIQNIYSGRKFGLPIDTAFTGLEVPSDYVDEYLAKNKANGKSIAEAVKDFKNKWLDPARGLPDWVLAEKDFASGAKNIEIARAMKTLEALKAEAKKIGFTDWDAFSKAIIAVNDVKRYVPDVTTPAPFDAARAAEGRPFTTPDEQLPALIPDAIKNLPESMIPFVYKMRAQIDGLTKDLVASGYVTPEQAVTLEKNIGAYVNRSYRMYNEKGWKPEQQQIADAIKYLADQYIKELATDNAGVLTYEQVLEQAVEKAKKDVQAIMDKKRNPYFNATVDARNTGILKERQDIPQPIRKLMGEYTDPGTVFVMTVAKQAALKASSQYLSKMREFGLGSIFFEKNDPKRPSEFSVEIASPGAETKSPLNGLYTTPEISDILQTQDPTYNDITNLWMKLVGAIRWGKTVGSVVTQFKNFESNLGFAVMNGLLYSGKNTQAFNGAKEYVKGQYSKKELDAITEKLIKLNLVGQSVGARELSAMLGSGDIHDIALDVAVNPEGRWGKQVSKRINIFGAANKLYRISDDFWKAYAYLNEREMVARGRYDGKSYDALTESEQEKVDIESSERVKNTWPTYDRVVEGAKKLSKSLPILGNFPSFQAESVRTLVNTVKQAREDMRDPQMRAHGVRRAMGIATYLSVRAALTYAAAQAAGMAASGIMGKLIGDDDEERKKHAMKHALPPYAITSDIFAIHSKSEPHKYTVYSLSSLDPYGIMFGSVNALTEGREGIFGKRMEPGVPAAAIEFFSSFLEPEMTFDALWSITNNTNSKTGRAIVNDSDTDLDAFKKVMGYVWDQLEPSTVSLVKRGMERGWAPEAASLAGARPIDVDLHKAFGFILSDFGKQVETVNSDYNKIKYNEKYTPEQKAAAEADAENRKAFLISKVNTLYKEFIELGANPKELDEIIKTKSAVKTTGFDKATKKYIKTGIINPKALFK